VQIVASDGGAVHVESGELSRKKRASGESWDPFTRRINVFKGSLNLHGSTPNLVDGVIDRMIEECPSSKLDGSSYDPVVGKAVSRLANPHLLTVALTPSTPSVRVQPTGSSISDVAIVRR
jgi:hypothetical protein